MNLRLWHEKRQHVAATMSQKSRLVSMKMTLRKVLLLRLLPPTFVGLLVAGQ